MQLPRLCLGVLFGAPVALLAQTSPAPAPAAPVADERVELSPFTVNTTRDLGYQAENTLAGSRLNTKLRDTPGSVSVFTKEFLDDLAITDLKGLVEYTVNTEIDTQARVSGSGQNAFINAQNLNNGILTRGIAASQGLDYFASISPADSYRVGRFDDSRGPNSILFGVGAVGGIINQSSKTASVTRPSANLRYSFGSWDRSRAEFDANVVLKRGVAGLTLAALDQQNGGWRSFDFQDKRRLFGSLVFRPTRAFSLTVMGETGRDQFAVVRSGIESEEVLAWYDNRRVRGADAVTFTPTTALPTAAQIALGVTTRNGASGGLNRRVTYIENTGAFVDMIGTYLTGTYNNAAVRAPDGTPGRTGGTLRLSDPGFYPYFNNAAGPGMRRSQTVRNYTVSADWHVTRDLYLNFAHNFQETDVVVHLMVNASPVLRGDPNRTLGLSGPANPFVGRLYFDGDWRRDVRQRDTKESRVSANYNFNPKPAWLGRHNAVGLISHLRDFDTRANSWLVLAGRPFSPDPINANNRVTVRNYITEGDHGTYRVGDWRSLPATINFSGRIFETAYANDAATGGTNGGAIQETDSILAAVQSHFLRDRLVTTVGVRRDRVTIRELGYRDDPIIGAVVDPDPAKHTVNNFRGRTQSAGAALHVTDWLTFVGNRSSSVGVPSFNRTVFPDGNLAGSPRGEGADYGLGLDLLGGKVNAKLVRFTSAERGATGAFGATGSFTNRNQRVMEAFGGVLSGAGLPYTAAQWTALARTYTPGVSGALNDFESEGYEARLTANLTRNWRLLLNYSYTDSARANLYDEAIAWYGLKRNATGLAVQGVAQNAAGQFVIDPNSYVPGGAAAKWIELGGQRPTANPGVLTTSASVTVAQELFNLVEDINDSKLDQEKRWGLRPHKASVFTAYDFKSGWVRGFTVGGGWRWRSANIIGTDPAGKEITGRALGYFDLMLRYARKVERLRGTLSVQINVSNLLDTADPVPTRLLTNDPAYKLPYGRGTPYGRLDLVDPREVRFTTTYAF